MQDAPRGSGMQDAPQHRTSTLLGAVLDPDGLFWCVPPADVIAGKAGGRQQVCMNTAQREEVCPNTAFGKTQLEKVARTNSFSHQ